MAWYCVPVIDRLQRFGLFHNLSKDMLLFNSFICYFLPVPLHHFKNHIVISFIRFGAHKSNGFLASFEMHYLSAVMVGE